MANNRKLPYTNVHSVKMHSSPRTPVWNGSLAHLVTLVIVACLMVDCSASKGPSMTKATSFHSGATSIANKANSRPTDLTRNGACSVELEKLCPAVASGAGLLAQCLLEKVEASTNRGAPVEIAISCSEELHRFRGHAVDVGGLRALPSLRKACYAETSPRSGSRKPGQCSNAMELSSNSSVPVLECLRKGVASLPQNFSDDCYLEILKYDSELDVDRSLDLDLQRTCARDLEALCSAKDDASEGSGAKETDGANETAEPSHHHQQRQRQRQRGRYLAEREEEGFGGSTPTPALLQCLMTHLTKLRPTCSPKVLSRVGVLSQDVRLDSSVASACETELRGSCGTQFTWGQSRGRVLRCLWDLRHRGHHAMTTTCANAVKRTVAAQASDYRANSALSLACNADLNRVCLNEQVSTASYVAEDGEEGPGVEAGEGVVLQCLKEQYFDLSTSCKREVAFVARVHGEAWGYDRYAARVCEDDKVRMCNDRTAAARLSNDGSDLPGCLRDKLSELSDDCYESQVVQARIELASVDGSFIVSSACSEEVQGQEEIEGEKQDTVCPLEGDSDGSRRRQVQCLMQATVRGDPRMTHSCAEALYQQAELSTRDFQLKYGLPSMCGTEARRLCRREAEPMGGESAMRTIGWVSPYNHTLEGSARMLDCLVDKRKSIRNKPASAAACKLEVNLLAQMQADDWRASPAATVCHDDVDRLCSHVEHGGGRVHACLASHLHTNQLSHACLIAELTQQRRSMEQFSLNPALIRACPRGFIRKVCPFQDDRAGDLVSCLLEAVHSPDMPTECAAALRTLAAVQLSDYRLQPTVSRACTKDIQSLCGAENRSLVLSGGEHSTTGALSGAGHVANLGSVLHCLSSRHSQLTSRMCQRAVINVETEWIDGLLSDAASASGAGPDGGNNAVAGEGAGTAENKYPSDDSNGGGITSHVDPAKAMTLRYLCREDAKTLCDDTALEASSDKLTIAALQDCLLSVPSPTTSLTSPGCRGAVLGLQGMLARDPLSLDPALKADCTVNGLKECRAIASSGTGLEALLSCHESKRIALLEGGGAEGSQECEQALTRAVRHLLTPAVLQTQLESLCGADLNRAKAPYANCRAAADPRFCLEERLGSKEAGGDLLIDPSCKNHLHATAKAWLEEPATMPGFSEACDTDVKVLCSRDVGFTQNGLSEGMATYLCLQAHASTKEVKSAQCTALVSRLESIEAQFVHSSHLIMDACTAELQRFCPNVPDGQYRTLICLLTNLRSTAKRTARDAGEVEPFTQACTDQLQRFTKAGSRFEGIEGGEGRGDGIGGDLVAKTKGKGKVTRSYSAEGYELRGVWAMAAFASFVIVVVLVMRAVAGAPLPGAMTNDGRKKQYFAAALPDDEEMEEASAFLGGDSAGDQPPAESTGPGRNGGGKRVFSRLSSLADV